MGERRGGSRGTPEEVPPPKWRHVAPWGAGGDPRKRIRNETLHLRWRWCGVEPLIGVGGGWLKRAAHVGKGWKPMIQPSERLLGAD